MIAKRCIFCGKKRPWKWRGKGWSGTQPLTGKRYSYWSCGCVDFDGLVETARDLADRGLEYPEKGPVDKAQSASIT